MTTLNKIKTALGVKRPERKDVLGVVGVAVLPAAGLVLLTWLARGGF